MNYREPLTKNEIREHAAHRNSCSKITSTTPNNGIVKAAWAKARSIKSKLMPS